jgi:MinD superfamily P-loop ATPase
MYSKIAFLSYLEGTGRTLVSGQLYRITSKAGLMPKLFGYDMEKQDLLSSGLLKNAIEEPVYAMVPSLESARCNFCGNCLRFCSRFAIQLDRFKPEISILPDRCHSCGDCMKGCSHEGISQQRRHIGNLYQSPASLVYAGEAAIGEQFILPLFLELNQKLKNGELAFCDLPPGDSGFVSTSLMNANLAILIVVPSPEWKKQTKYMLDYLRSMKLSCCILLNKAEKNNDFLKLVAEFCLNNEIKLVGAIPLFESNEGIDPKLDIQGIEIFQNIWAEIKSFFHCQRN